MQAAAFRRNILHLQTTLSPSAELELSRCGVMDISPHNMQVQPMPLLAMATIPVLIMDSRLRQALHFQLATAS